MAEPNIALTIKFKPRTKRAVLPERLGTGTMFIGKIKHKGDESLFIVTDNADEPFVALTPKDPSGITYHRDELDPEVYRRVQSVEYTVEVE